jgi:hypothetical protein
MSEINEKIYFGAINILAHRIYNQTHFMKKEEFESETTDLLEIICEDITNKVKEMRK